MAVLVDAAILGGIRRLAFVTSRLVPPMIAWCYDGERGWIDLMDHFGGRGQQTVLIFRLIFVGFVVVGAMEHTGRCPGLLRRYDV